MAFIGDGGSSTGAFYEGMNFASVQKLPMVVIIEDNAYAYSTPIAKQTGELADHLLHWLWRFPPARRECPPAAEPALAFYEGFLRLSAVAHRLQIVTTATERSTHWMTACV
jgi:hypothetical protein